MKIQRGYLDEQIQLQRKLKKEEDKKEKEMD